MVERTPSNEKPTVLGTVLGKGARDDAGGDKNDGHTGRDPAEESVCGGKLAADDQR